MNTKIATILATALLTSTAALTVSDTAHAVVPGAVTHQGRLFDDMGDPVSDTLDVTFAIYDASSGGTELWSETISVDFVDGYYSARLGETNSLGAILDGTDKYMGVSIDGDDEMSPRSLVGSVPYAMVANDVNGDIHPTSIVGSTGTARS